jgi:hypothetical protein
MTKIEKVVPFNQVFSLIITLSMIPAGIITLFIALKYDVHIISLIDYIISTALIWGAINMVIILPIWGLMIPLIFYMWKE